MQLQITNHTLTYTLKNFGTPKLQSHIPMHSWAAATSITESPAHPEPQSHIKSQHTWTHSNHTRNQWNDMHLQSSNHTLTNNLKDIATPKLQSHPMHKLGHQTPMNLNVEKVHMFTQWFPQTATNNKFNTKRQDVEGAGF